MDPKRSRRGPPEGPQNGPQRAPNRLGRVPWEGAPASGRLPGRSRGPPKLPGAPRDPKMDPKGPPNGLRGPQNGAKEAPDRIQKSPGDPELAEDDRKLAESCQWNAEDETGKSFRAPVSRSVFNNTITNEKSTFLKWPGTLSGPNLTPNRLPEGVLFGDRFRATFRHHFGTQNGPKWDPRRGPGSAQERPKSDTKIGPENGP